MTACPGLVGGCLAAATFLFAACGSDHAVPEPGRYAYRAIHPAPGAGDTVELLGTLVIEEAGGRRLEGHWDGPQLLPELEGGEWQGRWYELSAAAVYEGRLVHRVTVGSGGRLACEGYYSIVLDHGEVAVPLACQLWPEQGAAPEPLQPPEGSRAVRVVS